MKIQEYIHQFKTTESIMSENYTLEELNFFETYVNNHPEKFKCSTMKDWNHNLYLVTFLHSLGYLND